jgi:hypothetical protein
LARNAGKQIAGWVHLIALLDIFCRAICVLGIAGLGTARRTRTGGCSQRSVSFFFAQFAAPLLSPFNRIWRRFGLAVSRVMNPVLLAIMFFGVLLPTGMILRLVGKDLLRLRIDKSATSYWIGRGGPVTFMTKQY